VTTQPYAQFGTSDEETKKMAKIVQLLVICLTIYQAHGFTYWGGISSLGFSGTTSSSVSRSQSTTVLYEGGSESGSEEEELPQRRPQNQTNAHDGQLETLELSNDDLQRFKTLRRKCKVIPILIMDAMLPGQKLEFGRYVPAKGNQCDTKPL
jgi:hypothetical protein